jgi:DNA-binding PadR family transcriptional regulator
MAAPRNPSLTTPDLVILSLLAERPMHGYEANLELARRQVRDWAGISRPQIYYSIEKLAKHGFLRTAHSEEPVAGPERRVFATSARGREALADALERENWSNQRDRPRFLTWIALSWQARPGAFTKQISRRVKFLETELAREEETLRAVKEEVGHSFHEAVWMLDLVIRQVRTELDWLARLAIEIRKRAPARNPAYFGKQSTLVTNRG